MGRTTNNNVAPKPEKAEEKIVINDAIVISEEDIVDEKELSEDETIEVIASEVIIEEKSEEPVETKTGKKYVALVSFCGLVSMGQGEVREITDKEVVKDLLKAKYIKEVK